MSGLGRIFLIRHGDTVGNSRERFHGSGDVALSAEGRLQMRAAASALPIDCSDIVVASPLRRAWASAAIVAPGAPVRLEAAFREIDFGRWEGLTAQEIEARDPVLYRDWQSNPSFDFPGGERRADFRARVHEGLERLLSGGARTALVVVHKGVVRAIAEKLCGEPLERGVPGLGVVVQLSRPADGVWYHGRKASHPRAAYSTP